MGGISESSHYVSDSFSVNQTLKLYIAPFWLGISLGLSLANTNLKTPLNYGQLELKNENREAAVLSGPQSEKSSCIAVVEECSVF